MTKSEIDKKLSLYGECFNLRFYTSEKKYYLSSPSFNPMLIAVYSENERDKAIHLFEVLESLFKSWKIAEELIKRLKTIREEQTETILKQKRKLQELEERNQRQYDRLKELTELMYERQWEKLENMVDDWEKADELLEQEWGTYCGDKE